MNKSLFELLVTTINAWQPTPRQMGTLKPSSHHLCLTCIGDDHWTRTHANAMYCYPVSFKRPNSRDISNRYMYTERSPASGTQTRKLKGFETSPLSVPRRVPRLKFRNPRDPGIWSQHLYRGTCYYGLGHWLSYFLINEYFINNYLKKNIDRK